MKRWTRTLMVLALLPAAGCAGVGLGNLGTVLGAPGATNEVSGELTRVDQRNGAIEVSSGFGQRTRIGYDSRTEVLYGNRRYSTNALENGDQVTVRVQRGSGYGLYAEQIYVERSVNDQTDGGIGRGSAGRIGTGRVERFDGRVSWLDDRSGRFEVRASNATYVVTLPYNPSRSTLDRFRRLRIGDRARFEGELLGRDRVELSRFL